MPRSLPKPTFLVGDRCPPFGQRSRSHASYAVDTHAGRYVVLCFYGSAADAAGRSAIEAVQRRRDLFDDRRASFFGINVDPRDEAEPRVEDSLPGVRFLWDFDATVSRLFGALSLDAPGAGPIDYRRFSVIVDPTLHILATLPFAPAAGHKAVFDFLDQLPEPANFAGFELPPPVLILPNVFEPDLRSQLIDLYEDHGGEESGVFRDGANVLAYGFKRRKDYTISDPKLISKLEQRITRRVIPEILRLFFIDAVYIERYIVGCYDSDDGAHFGPHRDNGPGLSAHRRFAVSINLNGDFDGGEVQFPEYCERGFKAPPGRCIVFPCAILHTVRRVRRGRRFAFLPFVYDEAGARIRETMLRQLRKSPPKVGDVPAMSLPAGAAE